jgi:hypothetical protein
MCKFDTFLKTRAGTALTAGDGQTNPLLQGRALPHNLATLQLGTGDGWIVPGEGFENRAGDHVYRGAIPVDSLCSAAPEHGASWGIK